MLENLTKRGLSALLVLILVLSMVPFSVFATEDQATTELDSVIAQIDTEPAEETEPETEPATEPEVTEAPVAVVEVTYPNTENDGHSHISVKSEYEPPLCEDPGMNAGTYCSLCGVTLTGRTEIAATGHDIRQYDAKLPTFSGVGWEAYEDCSRCGYTTYVEIPAMDVPTITDYESFITCLIFLEEMANQYVLQNPGKDPVALVIKYIRTGVDRYNSGSWGIMAGYEDADFAKFVAEFEDMLNSQMGSVEEMFCITSLKNIDNFYLPNGDYVDIGHMFGTMDITYHNKFGENHADVGGWAGDLVDLLEFSDSGNLTGSVEDMAAKIGQDYLLKVPSDPGMSSFSLTDFYGDLDALYLMDQLKKEGYQYEMQVSGLAANLMMYFTEDLTMVDRAEYFLKNRLDGVSTRNDVRNAVYNAYTTNKVISTLEGTREFKSNDLDSLRKAVCYAYADFICKLAGDYVESGENKLFTVFSSESANLAPGIIQQTKMATTADGKQMVYYLATADLTREDISLHANYHANDPTQGWQMQRVIDQAWAAEQRHSDPDSEHYIENYNVIVATNGAGFNMGTGEPSGVLVMEGVEYHPIDSAGFVGILKDGTPVIGTKEEYETIYKGQVQEAIACFGSRLIKDGKIVEGLDDSRAPRTAIGFTKTGKVVLLVVDGRQEGFSIGGGYQTLAQILLEAGCVEATNLDGGGSTTFVAQMPGEDDLSVINSPSDGYSRSVSTSWMIVSTAPSSTAFDHAVIDSDYDYLSSSAVMQMTAAGISPSGNTVELPEGLSWAVSDDQFGSITEDGLFTAYQHGDVDVMLMLDGNVVGSKTLHVVSPDNLYFTKTSMETVYGETKELPLKALYLGREMLAVPEEFRFSMSNKKAGTISGTSFVTTSNENAGVTSVTVTARLTANPDASASIMISLYKQGELTFDFEQATGGDRQLAWYRDVSNTTTDDNETYTLVDASQDMVTSYILAIDMTQIPIPARLEELTYMLPGSDIEGANAWTFLCQLAERISVLSEIKAVVHYNPNFTLDISQLQLINQYFTLKDVTVDEENCTLSLTLNWKKQNQAIAIDSANPMCIVNGLKLTPKADAQWDAKNQLKVINTGDISYKIYMRASALYSFSAKPENQQIFGLYSYINPNDSYDKGGYFQDTYKEFYDSYTLVNSLKTGWHNEANGFAYYEDGIKCVGFKKIDGLYYNLGENGIAATKTPYSGVFQLDGNSYYAKLGELVNGWQSIGNDWYLFNWSTYIGEEGTYNTTISGVAVTYEFEGGKLVKGFWHHDGVGLKYFYGPYYYERGWRTIDGNSYFFQDNYAATGIYPVRASHDIHPVWCEFDENGMLIGDAPDGIHWHNGKAYYVVNTSSQHVGLLYVDGAYYYAQWDGSLVAGKTYWISNTYDMLEPGSYRFGADAKIIMTTGLAEENGTLYYYAEGKRSGGAGLIEIDGAYYYIDGAAQAVCNQTVWVSKTNGLWPAGNYTFGADGKMVIRDGIVDGYYYEDGIGVAAGLILVDGNYYYAAWGGQLITNKTYWISNTNDLLTAGNYRFDAEGKINMSTAVVDENGSLYYYQNGRRTAGAGLVEYNGDYYHIDKSAMAECNVTLWVSKTNGYFPEGKYTFGADGKMFIYEGIVDGCYYENGIGTAAGLVCVDGAYYYAQWGGKLVMGQSCWISKTNGLFPEGTYTFDTDGKMFIYEGIVDGRYYEGGIGIAAGLINVDGDYYYAEWGGKLVAGKTYWVSNTNDLLAKGYYRFAADGKIIMTTEVVNENGTLYYYQDGIRTAGAGLVLLEGDYYYIGNGAMAAVNETRWITDTNGYFPAGEYTFGADGKMNIYNGIVNGRYYVDGIGTAAGLIQVDGDYYFAGYNGKLVMSQSYWVSNTNDLLTAGTYRFDAEGKIIMTTEIVNENGTLYYYQDGKRTAGVGLILFAGDYYYIGNGAMAAVNETRWITDTNGYFPAGEYTFGADGKMYIYNGIVNGRYYVDGIGTAAGLIQVDGDYYFAGYNGKLVTGQRYWVEKTNGLWPVGEYTFDADGKMIIYNGIVNGRYYVDGIGTAAGLIQVDGDYYFAGYNGKLIIDQEYWVSDGKGMLPAGMYYFGTDGKMVP